MKLKEADDATLFWLYWFYQAIKSIKLEN
jgi:hypothetical protein